MTVSSTTSSTYASLLNSTLSSLNSNNATSSNNVTGSPISTGPINVNALVSELITADSQPMYNLQQQQTGVQSQLSAYGQIQSALSSLQTATQALAYGGAFSAQQANVTGTGVSATVTGTPSAGSYSIGVSQLAQAQNAASAPVSSASSVVGDGTLTIQLGSWNSAGTSFTPQSGSSAVNITINSSNDTLSGISAAINAASAGVTASVVTDNSGSRIVLSSTNTGASNGFAISVANATGSTGLSQALQYDNSAQNMSLTQSAQDAKYSVNGLNLTSSSNSITTAINGLTLNLTQAPAAGSTLQSQVQVSTDSTSINSAVNSFVSSFNSLVNLTSSLTAYNASTKSASVLTGDLTTMQIGSQLNSILGSQFTGGTAGSGYSWLANVGLTFNTDGTLSLNTTTLDNALAANPSAVSQMFTSVSGSGSQQGFATQLDNTIAQMLGPNGLLTGAQNADQSTINDMNTQIASMQASLSQEQTSLIAQYSQLNANLVVAQQQQTNLANSLAGLG